MPDPKPSSESQSHLLPDIKSKEVENCNIDERSPSMEASPEMEASPSEAAPVKSEKKTEIKLGRSVSLTRTDPKEHERRTSPSPRPKFKEEKKTSVRDRKARFEDLYRNHRGVKEITKGKRNKNSRQHSPETEKEDLGSLLKEIRAMRGDIAKTNTKLDTVHTKIDNMEKHSKDTEKKIYKEMGKLREDMRINNKNIDMKIKETITENLEPKYEEMKI